MQTELQLIKQDIATQLHELAQITETLESDSQSDNRAVISNAIRAQAIAYKLAHLFNGVRSEALGGEFITDYDD